jgi:hypothetical protein
MNAAKKKTKEKGTKGTKWKFYWTTIHEAMVAKLGACWSDGSFLKPTKKKNFTNLNKINGINQMEMTISKWRKISTFVMKFGYTNHLGNDLTCKDR